MANGKREPKQVDLEELLTDDPVKVPPPPQAFYDFNKSVPAAAAATTFYPVGPSMCRQEFAEECDINALMKRYEGHDIGSIMRAVEPPVYVDFATAPQDLMGYMELMQNAEKAFMTLSAEVRRNFENDPVAFVDFASDPGNLDQMRSWGLAPPAPPPAVVTPPPVEPPVKPEPPSTVSS